MLTTDEFVVKHGPDSPNEKQHKATTISLLRHHQLLPASHSERIESVIEHAIMCTDMAVSTIWFNRRRVRTRGRLPI